MALTDLKSDLSKFRMPKKDPLVNKKRESVNKKQNQTPLSKFLETRPDINQTQKTPTKTSSEVSKMDNSSNFLGETNPSKVDNSSNFLGETDTSKMDNSSNFLGETTPTLSDKSSKFLGETDANKMDNSSNFLGETTPVVSDNSSNFLGETDANKMDNSSNFLGETTPVVSDNSSNFLGETTPTLSDNSSNFLGETDPNGMDNSSNFLGETNPNKMDNSLNFLGETTPKPVDFFTDIHAKGFTFNFNNIDDTKFIGINPNNTIFDTSVSKYGDFSSSYPGISFQAGYREFKVGNFTGDTPRYNPDRKYFLDNQLTNKGISQLQEMRQSPSFLDRMYNKFNLKDDSYNTSFPLLNHPLILRGIQRSGLTNGEPQNYGQFGLTFDDGLIRGGTLSSTSRALIDTARIGGWLLSPEGILWGGNQSSLQRTNKFGKIWTPTSLLTTVGSQHLGIRPDRPGTTPFGDETFKYKIPTKDAYRDKLKTIARELFKTEKGLPFSSQNDVGGFDSVYGIGISTTTRGDNTFTNTAKTFANKEAKANYKQKLNPFKTDDEGKKYNGEAGNSDEFKDGVSVPTDDDDLKQFGVVEDNRTNDDGIYAIGNDNPDIREDIQNQKLNPFKTDDEGKKYNGEAGNSDESKDGVSVPTDEDDLKQFGVVEPNRTTSDGIYAIGQDNPDIREDIQNQKLNPFKTDDVGKVYSPSDTNGSGNVKDGVSVPSMTDTDGRNDFGLTSKDTDIKVLTQDNMGESLSSKTNTEQIKKYQTLSYGQIGEVIRDGNNSIGGDFRKKLDGDELGRAEKRSEVVETRVEFQTPGKIGDSEDRVSWFNIDPNNPNQQRYDKVNAADINAAEQNDLVHLWFKARDGNRVQFRGTVSGITDTFSPSWDSIKYNGRADAGYKYGSFNRTVSFNFQVVATSRIEMGPIWKKLQYLSTMTMPTYGQSDDGYTGNLLTFRLGSLYNNKLAFLNSLSYSMRDDMSWEISPKGSEIQIGELPRGIDVSVGLQILDGSRQTLNSTSVYDGSIFSQ